MQEIQEKYRTFSGLLLCGGGGMFLINLKKKPHRKAIRPLYILLIGAAILFLGYVGYRYIPALNIDAAWIQNIGYKASEVKPLSFHFSGERSCPQVSVTAGGADYDFLFDTGCSIGILLTNLMEDKIPHTLIKQIESVNRDGSHRGWMKQVKVDDITVFGEVYENIETSIADWNMISSSEFNGNIGLAYFQGRTITLDYPGKKVAVSSRPIDYAKLDKEHYIVLPIYHSASKGEEDLLFFEAELDQKPVMVYLDTGKNYSFAYDPDCGFSAAESPSGFTDIPIKIGRMDLTLTDVARINDMTQAKGMPYPTMLELNSDQIWKCKLLVTIDLIDQKIIFSK
jgi:hypothetical protein